MLIKIFGISDRIHLRQKGEEIKAYMIVNRLPMYWLNHPAKIPPLGGH